MARLRVILSKPKRLFQSRLWICSAAIGVLALVAAMAGFIPARRASAIDPIRTLRYE